MIGCKTGDDRNSPKNVKGVIMDPQFEGVNELTVEELEELLNGDDGQESLPADDNNSEDGGIKEAGNKDTKIENTKAFAARLKVSTEKARREERESIAKSLGYESYEAMCKQRESNILKESGFNPEDVSPVVDKIVNERLKNDPRLVELEELRKVRAREFAKEELASITQLTNGEITSLEQLPREVIEAWKKKGSLKAAYMELEGEKLILKMRSEQSKGTTSHLANPTDSNPGKQTKRHLTAEEKQRWKFFNPNMSEEELNTKMINV